MVLTEENKVIKVVLAVINVYGSKGLRLKNLEHEFKIYCGYPIPWKQFGADSLKSWILTLPDVYLVKDEYDEEILFQQSEKSFHIRQLINKQKSSQQYTSSQEWYSDTRNRRNGNRPLPKNHNLSHVHQSINRVSVNDTDRFSEFNKLGCMLPLFYNHQALGDDFLLDIADTKFGYYIPEQGPQECGLCCANQTIAQLTDKVRRTKYLAPRVVVMIGLTDLLMRRNVNDMIVDLHNLLTELKRRNTRATLITLIPTPKMANFNGRYFTRMQIFNNAILDYSFCADLQCNVIDMSAMFAEEQNKFQRNRDRLTKITKKDKYRVFSDYGRKVFIGNLKNCLIEQLVAGH